MRLLLDTHVLLFLLDEQHGGVPKNMIDVLRAKSSSVLVSAASLWEIAIKHRLGKLPLSDSLGEIPTRIHAFPGMSLLDVTYRHVLHDVAPLPETKDPFDRLLLATAAVEGASLMTVDARLLEHPLVWRPA